MSQKTDNYNLLDEEWIPVLMTNGEFKRVGIKTALTQAGQVRQIAASNPMDRVAILRFLLALLYWCQGNPPEASDHKPGESFSKNWFKKLDDNKDCFNLLGEGKRFYQYRKAGDKSLSANYLIHEIPTGTNKWHFRHATEGVEGLCPACCAMGLLRLPLFSTSGGRGKPPGINAKPPIYAIPMSESLAATLRLSWRQISDLGTPSWEKPDLQLPKKSEVPLLTGLSWLPRRVWLSNPEEPEANCISCGRKEPLILFSVFAGIGSTKTEEGNADRIWRDPHVIYEQNNKGEVTSLHASDALGASDAAVGQWSRMMAGMLRHQNAKVHVWIVGFSTVQNDKYLEAMECMLPALDPVSPQQIADNLARIEQWQKKSFGLNSKLKPPDDKRSSIKHVEILPMLHSIRPGVECRVFAKAGELLAGGDAAWEKAAQEYRPMMKIMAQSLFPGFTTQAIQRRKQISRVLPDMRPKAAADEKPKKKKGGEK
jgi:hypothetical protein